MDNIIDIWERILELIEDEARQISPLGFDTWVRTIRPFSYEDDILMLSVPLDINKDMVNKRYLSLIKSAASIVNKKNTDVIVELEDVLENMSYNSSHNDEFVIDDSFYSETYLIKKFKFENFIVGESNRFASAAALAVADSPADSYNPLFLYGDVGLGKTHLMHAIGNEILKKNRSCKVLYISSERFTNDLINAIREQKNKQFREKYRNVDVLMIDDIQFFGGKDSAQDEFFHTFNHLYQSNKQIIISSDRPPKDIEKLEGRLRSRFDGGLICDIKKPDYETRVAILRQKVRDEKIDVGSDILEYIAQRVKSNIRELEGVLNKLIAHSCLTNEKINKDTISDIISDIVSPKTSKVLNIDSIIYEVSRYFDIDPKNLKSKSRRKDYTEIRQIAMYVIREVAEISLPKIGEGFGGRTHPTVLHSIGKVEKKMAEDEAFNETVSQLVDSIKNMF